MKNNKLYVIILAAGKGTRMCSEIPKVMHKVAGKPMIRYVTDEVKKLNPESVFLVINESSSLIIDEYKLDKSVKFVIQKEQKGTADAVLATKQYFDGLDGNVLILCADMPNIHYDTLRMFIDSSKDHAISFISTILPDPFGYGRVLRDGSGKVMRIVEEADASNDIKCIKEVNTGVYIADIGALFNSLKNISNDNKQKEYYLTDIVSLGTHCMQTDNYLEFSGINNRVQLVELGKYIWRERALQYALRGVTILDFDNVYIDENAVISQDVTIYPQVFIEGNTHIGKGSIIHSNTRIVSSTIGEFSTIKDGSVIEDAVVGSNCSVGPMANLRKGTYLEGNNRIGNFVEIKNTSMGIGSKASHLSYLGDAIIGSSVNIGCGSITCNYDGYRKYETVIGDNVFIGSDVQLIAPVKVGEGAVIAAGSTITKDVDPDDLALSRVKQVNLKVGGKLYRKKRDINK